MRLDHANKPSHGAATREGTTALWSSQTHRSLQRKRTAKSETGEVIEPNLSHDFSKVQVHADYNVQRQGLPGLPQLDEKLFPRCDATKGAKPCFGWQYRAGLRGVTLQPVFFRTSQEDPSPTGESWSRRFDAANEVWNKLGVYFFANPAKVLIADATVKTPSTSLQVEKVFEQVSESGIEIFMVESPLMFGSKPYGGGGTINRGGPDAKVILSDKGSSDTLLAHELGHVLGLNHPPFAGESNTIMQPSNSPDLGNPKRNTIMNYCLIQWPKPNLVGCIDPDP